MRNFRRYAALGLPVLVAGTLIGGPAGAQEPVVERPEAFAGSAAGVSFELTALDQGLTIGDTAAVADSAMTASADALGAISPLGSAGEANASVEKPDVEDVKPETCGGPDLGALADLGLTAGLACGSAAASTIAGLPVAEADASVVDVTVSANSLLSQLGLDETVTNTTATVFDSLDTILNSVSEEAAAEVGGTLQTVEDLLTSVVETDTLSVAVGESSSDVVTTGDHVASTGYAAGAVIEILPQGVIDEADPTNLDARRPVATIEVGAAQATASYTRGTTNSVADFDPALVRVTLDRTVAAGLLLNDGSEDFVIEVAPGADETILAGTPLESRIVAAGGSTYNLTDGVGARSDAVRLELLKGLEGGITLALASAKAEIVGVPQLVVQSAPPTDAPVELPRTGGAPVLPILGVGLLGLAVALRRLATR